MLSPADWAYILGEGMKCPEKAILEYHIHDDGVWLACHKCGFEVNLGFYGTIEDATRAQEEHDKREYEEK